MSGVSVWLQLSSRAGVAWRGMDIYKALKVYWDWCRSFCIWILLVNKEGGILNPILLSQGQKFREVAKLVQGPITATWLWQD